MLRLIGAAFGMGAVACGHPAPATVSQQVAEPKSVTPQLQRTGAAAVVASDEAQRAAKKLREQCSALPDSDCVELSTEEKHWHTDVTTRVEEMLPRLTACEQGNRAHEIRIGLQLDFLPEGRLNSIRVVTSTTNDCKLTDCIKAALAILKGPKAPEARSSLVSLLLTPSKPPLWSIEEQMAVPTVAWTNNSDECTDPIDLLTLGIRPEVIQRTVRNDYSLFRACYEHSLAKNPALCGRAQMRFTINPSGVVSDVRASRGTNLTDCALVACVAGAFRQISFPKPDGARPMHVVFPILFVPGNAR